MIQRSIASVLLLVMGVSIGYTEKLPEPLVTGSAPSDVMKLWGEPKEQIEREIRREVEWRYSNGSSVTFREGVVVAWKTQAASVEPPLVKKASRESLREDSSRSLMQLKSQKSADGLDFVREMAKEIPSGPDSPSAGNNASVAPQSDLPLPPPPPPPAAQQLVQPPNGGFQVIEPHSRVSEVEPPPELFDFDDGEE